MPIRCRMVPFAVLAAAAIPTGAHAQTAPDTQTAFIESVTVTAQKREQNPIEVPMALTAYSGDFLKKVNIQEFDKLSLFVPGFVVQNQSPNNPGFGLRGLTLDSGEAAQEPRVSVFEDDVSISTTRATYIELFDIERVEVARGPQTTLFGRSALMGGVNVIQNKADPSGQHFALGLETGDYGYGMMEGMANVPLTDDLAVRVAGRFKSRKGYVENLLNGTDYNSVNTAAARLSFGYKPNENFTADVIFNFEADHPSGTAFKSGTFVPSDPATGLALGTTDHNTGATLNTVAGFENNQALGLRRKVWDGKSILGYRLNDAVKLTSITAYRRFDSEEVFDPDGFSKPLLAAAEDERGDQFSQEVRVNYNEGGRFSAFAGLDYFYSNVSQRVPLQFDERMAVALLGGASTFSLLNSAPSSIFTGPQAAFGGGSFSSVVAPTILKGVVYNTVYGAVYKAAVGSLGSTAAKAYATSQATTTANSVTPLLPLAAAGLKANHLEEATNYGKTKSIDAYADATYRVTDALELDTGIRFTQDNKETAYASNIADASALGAVMHVAFTGTGLAPNYGIMTQPTVNNGDKISKSFSDDGLTWRVSARYALEKDTSFYLTYARGRRPKVISAKSPATPYAAPIFTDVAAEQVDSYEIGAKTLTLDGKLRLDTAVYFYDYTNFQSNKLDSTTNSFVTFNAGKAEAYGFEGTADWTVMEWADIFATYTYNRARFVGESVYKGNQFRLNPDHKLSVGASLRQQFLGGTFEFLPTYTWQSKIYFDDNNDIASEQDNLIPDTKVDEFQRQYGLLNLRLSYQPEGALWSVAVFSTNVLDQKFIKDAGNSGDNLGIPTFIAGEPRFFGASLSIKTR